MPIATIQTDQGTFKIEVPEGATDEDIYEYLESEEGQEALALADTPTDDMGREIPMRSKRPSDGSNS